MDPPLNNFTLSLVKEFLGDSDSDRAFVLGDPGWDKEALELGDPIMFDCHLKKQRARLVCKSINKEAEK